MKILLVEDDEGAAAVLQKALSQQYYLVELATDGQAAWELTEVFAYDLILLDMGLPKLDGISFCKRLRTKGDRTPILLLTGHDTSTDKVAGLDAGADDYVIKPYDFNELLARIRALLRRGSSPLSPVLEWDCLRLDPSDCQVTYNEQLLHLTAKEYNLLELFLRNTHRIFSLSALLDRLWSSEEYPNENTVRAHIKSLRHKLKKAGAADFIETLYGLGYRLKSRASAVKNEEKTDAPIDDQENLLSPSQNSSTRAPVAPELLTIWTRSQQKYLHRVQVLVQAVTALQAGNLDRGLQQQAYKEAHTLKGSLGCFGLLKAEQLSRQIEQMLQAGVSPLHEHLSPLVETLQQELEKPLEHLESPVPPRSKQRSRLLIVDDDLELAEALNSAATAWGIEVATASNLTQARYAIAHHPPDIMLLDINFPDSSENGLQLLAELTNARSPIPVLVFTAAESFNERVEAARLGARGFLQKPVALSRVMEKITQVLQQSSSHEAKLLIVDDDPQMLDILHGLLEPWGFKLTLLNDPKQFWETLEQTIPDLLILDVEMPGLNGIELCQVVRNEASLRNLPVLFLSAHTDAQTVHQVFTVGADDFVNKPIVGSELVARILNRLERSQLLGKLAQKKI